MTSEQWDELVRRLEIQAKEHPSGYRLRVGFLAVLGYTYILTALLVLAGAAAALVFAIAESHTIVLGKLLIPLAALALIIFRALGVKIPPPEGIRLDRPAAPDSGSSSTTSDSRSKGPA
jgi:hypothetical protein